MAAALIHHRRVAFLAPSPEGAGLQPQTSTRLGNAPAWILVVVLMAAGCLGAMGLDVMPPKPAKYFNDYANVVSSDTARQLNQTLEGFEKQTSSQIVVAVFPKMQSDSSIEDYTQRIAQNWGVGQKSNNNGAVLFVFIQDRKMFIQVGYGLEATLPDALCKRIVEDEIKPRFRQGNFGAGLSAGIDAMMRATRGEYKGTGRTAGQRRGSRGNPIIGLIVMVGLVLFFGALARALVRASRGTVFRRAGRSTWSGWTWGGGGGGWSGGGGGGGSWSSGGGFSGGGGSFGGGGAGGSW